MCPGQREPKQPHPANGHRSTQDAQQKLLAQLPHKGLRHSHEHQQEVRGLHSGSMIWWSEPGPHPRNRTAPQCRPSRLGPAGSKTGMQMTATPAPSLDGDRSTGLHTDTGCASQSLPNTQPNRLSQNWPVLSLYFAGRRLKAFAGTCTSHTKLPCTTDAGQSPPARCRPRPTAPAAQAAVAAAAARHPGPLGIQQPRARQH